MNTLKYIALALLAACASHAAHASLPVSQSSSLSAHASFLTPHSSFPQGVPHWLASHRAAAISNVAYQLSFSLSDDPARAVEGTVAIEFDLHGQYGDVALDYKPASADALHRVRVNGRDIRPGVTNEHILLPATALDTTRRQRVEIAFTAADAPLNRRGDLMYTLLVPDRARTLFPCFDQPDIKAVYSLTLTMPASWQAVANAPVASQSTNGGRTTISFAPTEPLSTYLFSFVAGAMSRREFTGPDGRKIACYYRETDGKKIAQLPEIASQVFAALQWQERFTGIAYPFAKYDLIILPGFQFGGMEHTGATLYNDRRMFLGEHPTPEQLLARAQLIAHETSHMWFGDLVTMRWFDDVWTKEVFANYFAARIIGPRFPHINARLNTMRDYAARALAQDRTAGTTAIRQHLDNLQDAGLVYNDIIYCKSPLVMEKIVELMGPDAFRDGIRRYLRRYAFGNATWDDLIECLGECTGAPLRQFSQAWVGSKGMPRTSLSADGCRLVARQSDPCGRGVTWPQSFNARVFGASGADTTVTVAFSAGDTLATTALPFVPTHVLANTDGRGYGAFATDSASTAWLARHWHTLTDPVARMASLMNLEQHYLDRGLSDKQWLQTLLDGLQSERDPLIAAHAIAALTTPLRRGDGQCETRLWQMSRHHPLPSARSNLLRLLTAEARTEAVTDSLYTLWQRRDHPLLAATDYTALSYALALRRPQLAQGILATERRHITNADRQREFDFVSRFTTADTAVADSLFATLQRRECRRIEPWATAALRLLTHPVRGQAAARHIAGGLALLPETQRTGDIFFPASWCAALLGSQRPEWCRDAVNAYLSAHPDMPPLLRGKILQSLPPFF